MARVRGGKWGANMPVLMGKTELMETLGKTAHARHVWMQRIAGKKGEDYVFLPSTGAFNVIFVELPNQDESSARHEKPRIKDFLGYGKRFHELRSTEEWMKELREGEED